MRRLRKNNLVRFLAASGVFVCAMIFSSFSYAAGGHSHIRAALCTIDQIKAASDADPGDTELKTLRDLFFNGDTPKEEMIKAFTRGSALPDTLGVFIGSIFKAGSFLHYGDTGLFYTLLLAKSGNYKSGKYVYGEESIAFALGAISHYVVDKYSHPIINEFAGASYEVAADHEVVGVNLDDGTVYKDKPHYKPLADEVTKRHKFYEFWLIRYELDQAGVDSINTTPELADDFKYYIFDFTYSHSKDYAEIIDNVFTKLWGNWWNNFGISPGRINRADTEMTIFIWYLSRCYIKNREANLTNDISKLCKYIPLPKVLLPTKDVSNKFQDDLASVVDPSGKVFYAGLSKKFLDCIDKVSPEETIKVFRRMAPFLKDMVVDKITVNDLKLDNINLDTGKLTTEAENKKRGIPDVAKDTNPKKTRAYITNRGANTLRSMEIDGDDLDFKPDVTVDSNPQAVVFDSTGRFAWVINRGSNTVSWVDTAEDEEVDQDRMDSKPVTRITVGSDPVALAMSPDDARLYVANNGSQTVSVIDTYKRELINTIPSSPLDPSLDVDLIHYIKVDPNGEYVYLSAEKQKAGVIKQINLKTKAVVTFALQNSRDPRGLAVDPSGKNILLIDHGETVRKGGYLHNVNIAGGIDEPVYPTIKGNMMRRMEVIDRQWFWCTVSTAPEIISILCEMSLPPVGIYDEIGGVDGLVEMTSFLGFSFLGFSFFWDIPWVVTLTYKTDPLFLRRGTNIDIPAVEKYTNYNTDFALACACFDYTGNIGFFDRKKKEFFAATKSILGDEWMSRLFTSYSNLAVSSIGDIIAMDLARDKAAFYPGKKLFKALAEDPEVLSRRPVDESDIWDLYGTIRSTVSPELIGKLNKPSSAAIQPEVYFPLSLFGRVIEGDKTNEGAQLDFMIFSRQDIKAIEVFQVEDNGSFTPLQFNGTDLEWAQKYDRFWELIVNDTINGQLNLGNQDSGKIKVNFKVTLDNGAVLNLGEAAEIKQIKSIQPPIVNLELEGTGDSQEEIPGGFIMLNDDDDDKDGKADNAPAQPQPVNNEDDLVKLIIKPVDPAADYSGSLTLKITQGSSKIKIWDTKTKNNEITLPKTYSTPVDLPKELWVEGVELSAAGRDVELALEYNNAGTIIDDKINLTVGKLEFYRASTEDANGNQYGYDEMDTLSAGNDDHISVKKNDYTYVGIRLKGISDINNIVFKSENNTIADIESDGDFLPKIIGKAVDKSEVKINARWGSDTGAICGTINVNVYKEIQLNGKYYRVYKDGAEAATIPPLIDKTDIVNKANTFFKYPVVSVSLSNPQKKGIAFDLNNNGRVDFYKNAVNPERDKIYSDLAADGAQYTDLVLLKDEFYRNWVISASVSAGDTTITMQGINNATDGGLVIGREYRICFPNGTNSETFTIISRNADQLTIDTDPATAGNQGFVNNHPLTADVLTSHTVIDNQYQTAGLSSNKNSNRPALVVGATADILGKLLAHEQMHGQDLSDVNDNTNVMHWEASSNPTTLPFRFKELVQVETGTPNPKPGNHKDNQWEKPTR